jgi:hypothetical protein
MARTVEVKPRNDAYTGLLAISFLALLAATVLMAMDAKDLGEPPAKLAIDVPGVTPGKAGEGLRRPDAGKIEPAPVPAGGEKKEEKGMSMRVEPGKLPALPDLPAVDAPAVVVPVAAELPTDPDAPPLPIKPFVPPM